MDRAELLSRPLSDYNKSGPSSQAENEGGGEAPSPFLPKTKIQYAWDSTSLGAFKKCQRFYEYEIIEGWVKPGGAIHLRWGQEYHSAIEDYERAKMEGRSHDQATHIAVRNLFQRIESWDPDPRTDSERLKSKAHLVRSVVWYFETFKDDPAKTVRLANGKPAVELTFKFELPFANGDQPYLLCGHLDKIVEFHGDNYVMDHKSTTSTPSRNYFDQYDPDNQMTLYSIAGQMLMSSPIRGVIIDAVQVAVGFSRFVRGFTYRTADRCDEWLDETQRWLALAERCATEGYWPMNDTACNMYGGCKFREVCSHSPHVRQRWLEGSFERRERWNPLKPR